MSDIDAAIASAKLHPSIWRIQSLVASYYGITTPALLRKTRERNIAFPRQIAMYLTTVHTSYSLPQIARDFGGYDHTTILYARRKIEEMILRRDEEVLLAVQDVSGRLEREYAQR